MLNVYHVAFPFMYITQKEKLDTEHLGPFLEVYKDDLIHFYGPLENNEGFYVPGVDRRENKEFYEDKKN